MLLRKFLATASFALATTLPAFAQTAPPPVVMPAPVVHARPPLWVVRQAGTTIYLFGTVHKLKSGTSWLHGKVKQAFDASETVMVETDMRNAASVPAALKAHSIARDGKTMIDRLPLSERARYRARLTEFGLPEKALDRLQPWAAASMLGSMVARQQGITREEGVEDQLLAQAAAAGKKVEGLETIDQQFGYFERMTEKDQVAQLVAALADSSAGMSLLNSMAASWSAGKTDRLARQLSADNDMPPSVRDTLIYERNRRWAKNVKALLGKPGTYFLAVGSGHLIGERNLRDELRAMGIKSKRVQ